MIASHPHRENSASDLRDSHVIGSRIHQSSTRISNCISRIGVWDVRMHRRRAAMRLKDALVEYGGGLGRDVESQRLQQESKESRRRRELR